MNLQALNSQTLNIQTVDIQALLRLGAARRASDVHLSSGVCPMLRVDGELLAVPGPALTPEALGHALLALMSPAQQAQLQQQRACDFSFEASCGMRFRVNVFQQARGVSAVFRCIATELPTLEDLQAPQILGDLLRRVRGLVLVTGPTGSGKSTTLAAMIHALNQSSAQHILTIEDPIEFIHSSGSCLVQQREIGTHARSFDEALRAALREDPDVILVGEVRDLETMRLALTAAETGHLVFATLHTSGAAQTIDRIVDVFPTEEKALVRSMLSESLTAVISQVLCKRQDGAGRVAAYEVMVGTSGIRHLIREGKVAQMYSAMQTGSASGMQTLDQSLSLLLKQGLIDVSQARAKAKYPESFDVTRINS